MKKVFMVLICLSMVFAAACSKSKKHSPCDGETCSEHGTCDDSSGRAVCLCDDGYVPSGTLECVPPDHADDSCADIECDEWEYCTNGSCHVKSGRCGENSDCQSSKCNMETHQCEYTGPCEGVTCNGHGECREGSGYGSGYGSGSSYQSGGIYCDCEDGYRPENVGETPTCINENCSLECGDNSYCDIDGSGNEYCKCIDGYSKDDNGDCVQGPAPEVCDLDCGFGSCVNEGGSKKCECPEGYLNENNDPAKQCIEDKCRNASCEEWEECSQADGSCIVVYPNCNSDTDCQSGEVCDLAEHECVEDKCESVNCGNGGVCTVEGGKAVCNCPDGYYDSSTSCAAITSQKPGWIGVQWPFTVSASVGDDPEMIYGRIWIQDETGCPLSSHPQHSSWKAQLGYKRGSGSAEYPVIAGSWTWIDANFNSGYDCADGNQNHEYMIPFPTGRAGNFIYIFRFSLDDGKTWWYADKGVGPDNSNVPGPGFITSATNYPGKATIEAIPETLLTLDSHEKTADSYTFTLSYHGAAAIDFAKSIITLNGVATTDYEYDETTKTFTVSQANLEPNKYSWLFRLVDANGDKIEPFFVPLWIGSGVDYADFGWRDAFIYQIMTDRFLNGDTSNDVQESEFPSVTEDLEKWKGGDFRGIIQKIDDGYFKNMGVNALWISTPVLNPHHSSGTYFTSYHAYHPLATGYSFDDDYGYANEGVDTAFGTVAELRELVDKAHKQGIRIIPDFVVNHVYIESELYKQHKNDNWFYPELDCKANGWSDSVIKNCWFAPFLPDFNYNNAEARKTVITHAIWLIQNFNFDGFRADALKHIDDIFVKELRSAIKAKVETTVSNHDMPDEAEVFYMVGESLGGDWPRYHTRADMVQGQVNEQFYYKAKDIILHGNSYNSIAYEVNEAWDKAFLTPQPAQGGTGGFPGAVMGNFFGNHDQDRALTECNGNYTLLKHAQTFLLTSPINIPMLYQGDDIGMFGKDKNVDGNTFDGGRRAVMKFTGLSSSEQDALDHVKKLGKFRKAHPALRYGARSNCGSTDDAWVYKLTYEGKTVIVGINKGSSAYNATCSGVSGSFTSYDGSSVNVSNGSVTVPANGSLVIGN